MNFEEIAPFLSERGQLEVELAHLRAQVAALTAENQHLKEAAATEVIGQMLDAAG